MQNNLFSGYIEKFCIQDAEPDKEAERGQRDKILNIKYIERKW